jgi:hypothetical protein
MLPVNQDEVNVVIAAMKPVVAKLTYMGFSIASHVTPDEYQQLATAAVQALDNFRNAPTI